MTLKMNPLLQEVGLRNGIEKQPSKEMLMLNTGLVIATIMAGVL